MKQYFIVVIWVCIILTIFGCRHYVVQSDDGKRQKIDALYRNYAREFPQVEGITVEELQKLQQLQKQAKNIVLVDVRSPEERAVSIVPGAVAADEFERNLEQYKNATVIAYCTIGYRSGKYAEKWRQQGLKILNLEGSLLAWSHVQGELIDATGVTKKVHVFGPQWQLIPDDYQPIW